MADITHLTQSGRLLKTLEITKYWHTYRPGIPDPVVDVLVSAARRDGEPESLLDLGTGDGQAVRVLLPYFRDIIAVDPVQELLDLADQDLRGRIGPGTRLRLERAAAEDYRPPAGWTASLVTMCRAFHWMDQPLVLAHLDPVVPATGVVAIFHDRGFWNVDAPWKGAVRKVIEAFLGEDRSPGLLGRSHLDEPYTEVLGASAFSDVEQVAVPVRRTWTGESILGYLYASSYAARPHFGDRVDEFETELGRALADHSDDGTFAEDEEFSIWLARKPRGR